MKGPLDGIRVIDWTMWVNGPLASQMLALLGAEVIKIEHRVTGDPLRGVGAISVAAGGADLTGSRGPFEAFNRNKKGITLDVTKEAGREIVYRLVEKADVFLHNVRLSVAERLKLDYATLSRYNPKLIYANITAFGTEGPDRDSPGMDFAISARSGVMHNLGEPDLPPTYYSSNVLLADSSGGLMASNAILAALMARERQGIGQEINVSALGGLLTLQWIGMSMEIATGTSWQRPKRSANFNPLQNHYQCSDGQWLVLCLTQADRHWHDFCAVMGLQELEKDPKFENMIVRSQNAGEFVSILDRLFATKSRDEWLRTLRQNKDFIVGPVNTLKEATEDPQVLANGYVVDLDHPALGTIKSVGVPYQLSKTPLVVKEWPEYGQHTEEVLNELLGYSFDDLARLREEEVI